MADAIEQRDFFISFNSADLAHAAAIDAALRGPASPPSTTRATFYPAATSRCGWTMR
jgi:hypothetical protein